jgi:peptide deformylase
VAVPAAPELRRLLADMADTMAAAGGTGLAAPQVFQPLRAFVFRVSAERQRAFGGSDPDDPALHGVELTALLNPEVVALDDTVDEAREACLSIPDLSGRVPRWRRIRYRARDVDGRRIERTASGFHARVVQHELDHLDGILFPERMRDLATLAFASEIAKSRPETGAGGPPPEGAAAPRGGA